MVEQAEALRQRSSSVNRPQASSATLKRATMKVMLHRSLFRLTVFVAGFGLVASSLAAFGQDDTSHRGRKYKSPPPTARIEVTIVKDFNGKPIENAAVVFHPMQGEKDKGSMELKTNEDGKTIIDVLPMGDTVRLQVIAHGYQTFGQDYKIEKADMGIQIRLRRPGEQYSIYKPHPAVPNDGKSTVTEPAPPAPAQPADPPAAKPNN
jgi:hypothetical protein